MSLNATSSISATASTNQVPSSQSAETAQKSSTDSNFKDEMKKISSKSETKDKKSDDVSKKDENNMLSKTDNKENLTKNSSEKLKKETMSDVMNIENLKLQTLSMMDINNRLTNDIEMMMNTNALESKNLLSSVNDKSLGSMLLLDFTNHISMSESDAEFFINLAQNDTITPQSVVAQAQIAFDSGVELSQVQQNVKISETLLNAINMARENNQPLRIDFDKNISVILRFGRDGSFAANFIPGDKVVEQYLKNNLESLKSTFNEKDIPYSDLSYSNRGSKQQKEQQRSKQQ